jgi:integrase
MKKDTVRSLPLLPLFTQFINAAKKGHRRKADGNKISTGTIVNYENTFRLLQQFSATQQMELRIRLFHRLNNRELIAEKNYWKKFYRRFTDHLYDDLDLYDGYVGSIIKNLRIFFNYLLTEKQLPVGQFHKQFFVPKEDIPVVALTAEQLHFLIHDTTFTHSLSPALQRTKDVFIFGCTVGLRYSDLRQLTVLNIEQQAGGSYLKVHSQKTNTFTSVLLPCYAVDIISKYQNNKKQLLPVISKFNLNKQLKLIAEKAGWTQTIIITRQKRGKAVVQTKESNTLHYRFCDMVSSHTMRRTAITTLLSLGMPELLVRKVSGHAPNSKEFFKYVALAQSHLDRETTKVYDRFMQPETGSFYTANNAA